jgi:hypothetical protein
VLSEDYEKFVKASSTTPMNRIGYSSSYWPDRPTHWPL